MNKIPTDSSVMMSAFSFKAPDKDPAEELLQMRAEGTVDHTFNLMPVSKFDDKGSFEIDKAYRTLTKDRNIKANLKTRQVKLFTDTREDRMGALATVRAANDYRRKAEVHRAQRLDQKRTRKDKGELEEDLFALFERQSQWTLLQLVKETNQPGQFLKEVLAEIALLSKKGPMKDLYTLKSEFLKGSNAAPPSKADVEEE
eukprot:gene10037-7928_t